MIASIGNSDDLSSNLRIQKAIPKQIAGKKTVTKVGLFLVKKQIYIFLKTPML